MTSPTHSGAEIGNESDQDEVSVSVLANSLIAFLPPPDQYAWSGPHQGQFGSPFDRLGPPDQSQSSTPKRLRAQTS